MLTQNPKILSNEKIGYYLDTYLINDSNLQEKFIRDDKQYDENSSEIYEKEEQNRQIETHISIIKEECKKYLLSEFKIVVISGFLLTFIFLLIKGYESKMFLLINFLYSLLFSLICGYAACSLAVDECELILEKKQ